jgi:hypothetical protein
MTSLNGELILNFATGEYEYQADVHLAEGESRDEVFEYVTVDNDGDTSSGTVTLHITRAEHEVSTLTSDTATVDEAAMSSGTESQSSAEVATGNLFANDTLATGAVLKTVAIDGGITETDIDGNITVTTKDGNTLFVNTQTGDYIYTLNNALDHQTVTLADETFDTSADGWSNASVSDEKMLIEASETVSKTYDFGADFANQTVHVSFDMNTLGDWESSGGNRDYFNVIVDGNTIYSDSYDPDSSAQYSFDVTLDANGQFTLSLEADTTASDEEVQIDNLFISQDLGADNDSLVDSFVYTVEDIDGTDHIATLDVTILDDKPIVNDTTAVSVSLPESPTTNLMLTLDVSGSMDSDVDGNTRFEIAQAALIDTIDAYAAQGDTYVYLTLFNSNAVNVSDGWISAADAKEYISNLYMNDDHIIQYDNGDGDTSNDDIPGLTEYYTNYEAAVAVTDDNYDTNRVDADKTVAFFISDGSPTTEYDDGSADEDGYLDSPYVAEWSSFINDNDIELEVIGIGDDVDETYLNEVQVIDGKSAIVVTDETQLSDTMLQRIESVSGALYGDDGYSGVIFGADGGHVLEISYDGTTYSYDEQNPIQDITLTEGVMSLNFENGEYVYTPTTSSGVDIYEDFVISVTDSDGDTSLDQPLTLVIGVDSTYIYDGTTDIDAGAGYDTIVFDADLDVDFSDANVARIENAEKLDLTEGTHTVDISLDDVLNMTDEDNTLEIAGDSADTLNVDTSGWTQESAVDDGSSTTYTYSNGSDSITLIVDDNINNTGL